jgi:hypothetical protein
MNYITSIIKEKVSQKRNRFMNEKYNLDLSYITKNLIAMSGKRIFLKMKYQVRIKNNK